MIVESRVLNRSGLRLVPKRRCVRTGRLGLGQGMAETNPGPRPANPSPRRPLAGDGAGRRPRTAGTRDPTRTQAAQVTDGGGHSLQATAAIYCGRRLGRRWAPAARNLNTEEEPTGRLCGSRPARPSLYTAELARLQAVSALDPTEPDRPGPVSCAWRASRPDPLDPPRADRALVDPDAQGQPLLQRVHPLLPGAPARVSGACRARATG
jgi:hypothetical protein